MALSATAARLSVEVNSKTKDAEQGLERTEKRFHGLGVASMAAKAAIGAAAVGAVASIAHIGMAYQDSLNTFQAVSGANVSQMAAVSAKAKALGNDLSLPATSAAGAATAMTELAKAGLSVNDTMAAAKGTLQLAAAAGTDEATAATLTANALNAFHLSGNKAVMVADLLAGGANASAADIGDMGLAMQASAAVFSAAHVPIQDMTTAIAEMANNGIKGSDAGTSLKTMMLALQSPTNTAAKLMKQMGVNVYDAHGKMVPFRQLIAEFTAGTAKMTQKQRDNALATIFGTDAVRSANIVLAGGTKAWDGLEKAVTKQGAAGVVAAAKMKGLHGAIQGLQSNLETAAITIYEKVAPSLESLVREASGAVSWLGDHLDGAINAVTKDVQAAVRVISPYRQQIAAITGAVLAMVVAYTAANKVIGMVKTGFDLLRMAMAMNPWVLLIAAVVGLITYLVIVNRHNKAFMESIHRVVDAAKQLWRWFAANILPMLERLAKLVLAQIIPAFRGFVMNALKPVRAGFKDLQKAIAEHRPEIEKLVHVFEKVATQMIKVWGVVIKFLYPVLGKVLGTVIKYVIDMISIMITVISKVIDWFSHWKGHLGSFGAFFVGLFQKVVDFFFQAVHNVLSGAAQMFGWVPGIGGKLKGALAAFDRMRAGVDGTMSGMAADMRLYGADAAQGLANGINDRSGAVYATASHLAQGAAATIRTGLKIASPSKVMHGLGYFIAEGLRLGILSGEAGVRAATHRLVAAMKIGDAGPGAAVQANLAGLSKAALAAHRYGSAATTPGVGVRPVLGPLSASAALSGGAGGTTILAPMYVQGSVITERELAEKQRANLIRTGMRTGKPPVNPERVLV